MHTVARNITQRFTKCAPKEFGQTFSYNKVYYAFYDETPITVEEYVDGEFHNFINNDGQLCWTTKKEDLKSIYMKAETLVHYSCFISDEKMMLLDIQGSSFQLYDPEIFTSTIASDDEIFFCSENLSYLAIGNILNNHKCSPYGGMMGLESFPPHKESEPKTN